ALHFSVVPTGLGSSSFRLTRHLRAGLFYAAPPGLGFDDSAPVFSRRTSTGAEARIRSGPLRDAEVPLFHGRVGGRIEDRRSCLRSVVFKNSGSFRKLRGPSIAPSLALRLRSGDDRSGVQRSIFLSSLRDLVPLSSAYPALTCRAILGRPSGAWISMIPRGVF